MNRMWRAEEIQMLKDCIDKGMSIEDIAEKLDRTESAVKVYARKHGIRFVTEGCAWTDSEMKMFADDWVDADMTKNKLQRKYGRTWTGLRSKAFKMGLGERPVSDIYLTIKEVSQEMQIHEWTVRTWLKLGLNTRKSKVNKTVKHLIDTDDLLIFLESHQYLFDASKVSKILFYKEPAWLKEKRKHDSLHYRENRNSEWSIADDNKLVWLFKCGKTDEEIAFEMKRTPVAVQTHRFILGLSRPNNNYSDHELKILREWSDYKTVSELSDMLPGRTAGSISRKCYTLGIPYHESKSTCKWSDDENKCLVELSRHKSADDLAGILHRSKTSIKRQLKLLKQQKAVSDSAEVI